MVSTIQQAIQNTGSQLGGVGQLLLDVQELAGFLTLQAFFRVGGFEQYFGEEVEGRVEALT